MATAALYGKFLANSLGGESALESIAIDLLSDTIKVALLDSGHSPNQDSHEFFDDVDADEISGTGYTAGGTALASKALTYTAGTNVVKFDADDLQWTTATFAAAYAVIYKDTGNPVTSPLIGYVNFGGEVSVTAGTFTLSWHANGIFTITVGAES